MADVSDLVRQYERFERLEPVSKLEEIKYGNLAKLNGTVARIRPNDGLQPSYRGKRRSLRWSGQVGVDFVLQSSGEHINLEAEYPNEDAQHDYNSLRFFFEDLGDRSILEVVIKTPKDTKQPNELYMVFGNGKYFLRGFRDDYLKELEDDVLVELGIKELPEKHV